MEKRTARMLVRSLESSDRKEYVRALQVSWKLHEPWMPRRLPGWTFDDLFDQKLARDRQGTTFSGIGVLGDGRIAGFFNLNDIVRGPFQSANAGWAVSAEVAGQGFATEGVLALLSIAFAAEPDGVGLHRVGAGVMPSNTRSLRVAEKCGFRQEGLALRYLQIAGVWEDHVMFAITAEDWASGKNL